MMKLHFFAFLCFFVAAVVLSSKPPPIAFNQTAGMNLTNTSNIFFYRNTTVRVVQYDPPANCVFSTSNKINAPFNIVGGGVVVGDVTYSNYHFNVPPSLMGFFSFGQPTIEPDEVARMIYYGTTNNITKSFLAMMLLGVAEFDKSGAVVKFIPFNITASSGHPGWTQFKKLSESNEGVSAYTSTYTSPENVEFRLTVIGSDVAGILTYAYTPVSPMSVSYVLEINNYPYKNSETHLGLLFATSIRRNEGIFARNMTARLLDDESILTYITVPNYTYADGKLVEISLTSPQSKPSVVSIASDLIDMVSLFLYEEKGLVRYQVAHFPKTALDIVYGVTIGGGDPIYRHVKLPITREDTGAAASLVLSLCSLLLAAFLLF